LATRPHTEETDDGADREPAEDIVTVARAGRPGRELLFHSRVDRDQDQRQEDQRQHRGLGPEASQQPPRKPEASIRPDQGLGPRGGGDPAEHERRAPREAVDDYVRGDRHRDHRGEDEDHPGHDRPPGDVEEPAKRGAKRRRVDDRRQEQQDDDERVELEVGNARQQRHRDPGDEQHDRRGHPYVCSEGRERSACADRQGDQLNRRHRSAYVAKLYVAAAITVISGPKC
jgi:hypothetical protein